LPGAVERYRYEGAAFTSGAVVLAIEHRMKRVLDRWRAAGAGAKLESLAFVAQCATASPSDLAEENNVYAQDMFRLLRHGSVSGRVAVTGVGLERVFSKFG